MILVIVPTLGRPQRLAALAANIGAATAAPVTVLFVTEPGDFTSAIAAEGTGAQWCMNTRKRCYAGALNSGYESAAALDFSYVFAAADDLRFADGWDVPARQVFATEEQVQVVGTNDLHNPYVLAGEHATAYLIDRRYLDRRGGVIDQPAGIVHCEAYDHNYADTEFVETAKSRGAFKACLESVVEHMHPVWGIGEWDEGYTRSQAGMAADSRIFADRQRMWAA
jgi:hypothetical protein